MARPCPLCGAGTPIPTEIETRVWLEYAWRFKRSGLVQTALRADVDPGDYEQVQRQVGRWYGPWGEM